MTEHTLQTQNLSVGYDETTIIEDLNLEIPAHKVSVIIGANGCGKSTLMKTLSRLLKPEKGQVVLDGKAVHGYPSTQLAQMRGQSDRNIRKVRNTIRKKLQKRLYAHLCQMQDEGKSLTLRERQFMEEYAALLGEKGKDAVIRRENKTKRRKKKAALDGGKGSE